MSDTGDADVQEEEQVSTVKKPQNVLFISNLPYEATQSSLETLIADNADVQTENVEMLKKGSEHRLHNCGLAVITFKDTEDASKCAEKLNGHEFGGRRISISTDKFE